LSIELIALKVFYISLTIILYTYLGYPALIAILAFFIGRFKRRSKGYTIFKPRVSIIIPARNEEKNIRVKIENTLDLKYPADKLEIIVSSDGSNDRTNEIVSEYADRGVKLVTLHTHSGKSAAQNAGLAKSTGEIIVFSDATGIYQAYAVSKIVAPFNDPSVGCVTGKVTSQKESAGKGAGTDMFRSYERFIRARESIAGNLAVATGSIFAVRRGILTRLNPQLSDDFLLPLQCVKNGYRVIQETQAISVDDVNPLSSVFRRRKQVISKDFRTLMSMKELLNPFKFPLISWGLFSHKMLRWFGGAFFLICFVSSGLLIGHYTFSVIFALQLLSYLLALAGWLLQYRKNVPGLAIFICNFYISNIAALVGIIHHFLGKQTGIWEPARS
jgi:cellulose synthase/poly-beta-1,6-N-acetylglucosamine synthase-like glycosyltransferase